METNMSFWSLFSPALLVSLVLLVIGIVIIRFTEAKGIFVGLLFIAFSMVVGINSCSRMRTVAGRSKIELCGINLNMDSETAGRTLNFSLFMPVRLYSNLSLMPNATGSTWAYSKHTMAIFQTMLAKMPVWNLL